MVDPSPANWHLTDATLLFAAIVLAHLRGYGPFDERFTFLFNSYYVTLRRGCSVLDAG